MGLISSVSPWDKDTYGNDKRTLRVLIECEKGSIHKYEYDDEIGAMVIVRDLDKAYPYPFTYGCIPQTLEQDGDALDAIVVCDEVIRSGTIVNCLPLGIIRTIDKGEQDDKLLCIPFFIYKGEINVHNIVRYLERYKYPMQSTSAILGFDGPKEAVDAVVEAHQRFLKNQK